MDLLQVSPSPSGGLDEESRGSSDISDIAKLAPSLNAGSSVSQGIGRGVSLGPSGLEIGLGKGFGSGPSVSTGIKVVGVKDYGVDFVDRRKGCTRRALVEGADRGASSCIRQPLVKGGESIL